jgi:hypothetical protein
MLSAQDTYSSRIPHMRNDQEDGLSSCHAAIVSMFYVFLDPGISRPRALPADVEESTTLLLRLDRQTKARI